MGLFKRYWQRLVAGLEQFYSPKELRALGLFLLAGIAGLTYRIFDSPVKQEIKLFQDPQYIAEARQRDSVFQVLARRREVADSFYFYYPDTVDVAPKSRRNSTAKEVLLASASISLNTSGKDQLMQLPAIGPATADLILEYRAERGKFRTLTEIMNVRGIGQKKFEKIKPYLRLD